MASDITVSVKCMVFNHGAYLKQCLEGFVRQKTDFKYEVIVHDDASTDFSAGIIKEYADNYPEIIKPIFETENQYSAGGFYRVIKIMNSRIKGKYVALCEGDDYWIDEFKLQKQVDYMESHTECGLVYTRMKELIQTTGNVAIGWSHQADFEQIIAGDNPICTPTVMFRKDLYDLYFHDVDINPNWLMADYPLWLYLSFNSEIKCLDDITAVYRSLPNSASHSSNISRMIEFTKSGYDISIFFVIKYSCHHLQDKITQRTINSLFKLSLLHNKNISREIIRFAYKNKGLSFFTVAKVLLYSNKLGRKYLRNKNLMA